MKRKCSDCKHSTFWGFATDNMTSKDNYTCNLKKIDIDKNSNCRRFIKRNGMIDKLQKHLKIHWKFWISTLIAIIAIIIALLTIE